VKAKQHFSDDILADFRERKGLRIRAWSIKPRGWFRTLLEQPRGTVQIAEREIAVRAARTRDKRLRDAVDRAYLDKYNTRGAIKYAGDLGSAGSRATTLELRPLAPTRP